MAQVTAPADPRDVSAAPMREERRIVTALFADLKGSTAIAERLDPEDAREVLGGAVARIIEQVDALDGTVKDLAGDGVLALFGAPIAHEDDAERAVLCGLRIEASIAEYATVVERDWGITGFSARVGIETGSVVMGPVGAGSRVEYGAVGDALNTAARLEALASPGTVLVGPVTRQMIGHRFEWGPSCTLELKGKETRVEAAVAIARTSHPVVGLTSFEAPIVGRAVELEALDVALTDLARGRGSVVTLEGDAGVGKSRLLSELRQRFTTRFGGGWLEGAAASYGTAVPYLPYRNLLLTWMGVPLDASAGAVDSAIQAVQRSAPETIRAAIADLAPLISQPLEYQPTDAQAAQAVVFRAMSALVVSLAAKRPVAITLEDLHWSDPTSLALTESLVPLTVRSPLLIVSTYRPEPNVLAAAQRFEQSGRRACRIRLGPLSREADREFLDALVGRRTLPIQVERRLLDTTDGNPFFIEEQVRALVDQGALVREQDGWSYSDATTISLAPTVERAVMARVDRLSPQTRTVLLAASVLGIEVEPTILAALTGFDAAAQLGELKRDEFLVESHLERNAQTYAFRHALVQDAIYGSLLRRQRRDLHARAASAIEAEYEGQTDEMAVVLGRHLAQAGDAERAIPYLITGARRAAAAFANAETAALCEQALDLLKRDDAVAAKERRSATLELLELQIAALRHVARYDDALRALQTRLELTPDDELTRARVHVTMAEVQVDAHRYSEALAELDVAEHLIEGRSTHSAAFAAWLDVQMGRCNVLYWTNDINAYAQILEKVEPQVAVRATSAQQISFYDAVRSLLWRRDRYVVSDELLELDRKLYEAHRKSDRPEDRAWAPFHHGMTLLWHRDIDQAEKLMREALVRADELDEALLRSRCLTYLMVAARLRGDVNSAEAMIGTVREAAREGNLPEYEALAAATAAWVAWRRGDAEQTERAGLEAIEIWERVPNRYPFDWMASLPLVDVALSKRNAGDALRSAERLLSDTQQPLPEPIAGPVRRAMDLSDAGDEAAAMEQLAAAIEGAKKSGYL